MAVQQSEPLGAGPQLGADGQRLARNPLLLRDGRRVHQLDPGIDQPERGTGIRGSSCQQPVHALRRGDGGDRGENIGQLPVPALHVGAESVLAFDKTGEEVPARHLHRLDVLACSYPDCCRCQRPERGRQVEGHEVRHEDPERRGDRQGKQEDPWPARRIAGADQDLDEPEDGQREHRRGHQVEHQPGVEREAEDAGSRLGPAFPIEPDPADRGPSQRRPVPPGHPGSVVPPGDGPGSPSPAPVASALATSR